MKRFILILTFKYKGTVEMFSKKESYSKIVINSRISFSLSFLEYFGLPQFSSPAMLPGRERQLWVFICQEAPTGQTTNQEWPRHLNACASAVSKFIYVYVYT